MSSKYLLARPLSGIFLQDTRQRLLRPRCYPFRYPPCPQQPLQFLAFQYRRRRFDAYLCCSFPGAGENHQMLHLDIVNFILRRKSGVPSSIPLFPLPSVGLGNRPFGFHCLPGSIFHPAAAPIISCGLCQAGDKGDPIKPNSSLVEAGRIPLKLQIQIGQHPKLAGIPRIAFQDPG